VSAWRSLSALAPALALAAAPGLAAASPAYSTQLARRVGRTTEPPCGVCHAADPAADVAALTPFGQALRDRGFTDGTNLIAAFDRLASERVDSDGDRSTDADELGWGGDPNGYDGVRGDPAPEVEPGFCGVGPAPGAPSSGARLLAAALAAAAAFRRQSRRAAKT
jgi:hypothetical protein